MSAEDRDTEHLQLLRVGHYVGAGLAVAGIAFLGLHYLFLRAFFAMAAEVSAARGHGAEPDQVLPWFYVAMGLFMAASAALNLISAACIARRRARTFSMVVAGLNCTHAPLGTALGVLSILVLSRESVRQSYRS